MASRTIDRAQKRSIAFLVVEGFHVGAVGVSKGAGIAVIDQIILNDGVF